MKKKLKKAGPGGPMNTNGIPKSNSPSFTPRRTTPRSNSSNGSTANDPFYITSELKGTRPPMGGSSTRSNPYTRSNNVVPPKKKGGAVKRKK